MSENNGSEERKRAWTPEVIIQAFKEGVTALLGLAVVIYTLVLAGQTIALVGQEQKMADAKDVLLLVLGLAGVVVGYYFGRVPADARASQATERAEEATAEAEQVRAHARAAADDVERVMDRLAPAAARVRGAEEASMAPGVESDLRQIREELRAVGNIGRRR
jgi:pyruvate/2-oxoglutarate dehydrogenase complex dihydrolipoamide acyltransferase (E2) component